MCINNYYFIFNTQYVYYYISLKFLFIYLDFDIKNSMHCTRFYASIHSLGNMYPGTKSCRVYLSDNDCAYHLSLKMAFCS